jgi:uncharacterized protein DUF4325
LRDELLAQHPEGGELEIDFAGVTNVSYSFADEFVGKLASRESVQLKLTNMVPSVQRSVDRASARRLAASACR